MHFILCVDIGQSGPLTGGLTRQFLTGPKKIGGPGGGPRKTLRGPKGLQNAKTGKKRIKKGKKERKKRIKTK